ncbi:MAG TPA: hypothetical protein PKA64_10245, partial [Myxococcota bacterium]|nr:hypothetical protein [Myxococcota bacterium]
DAEVLAAASLAWGRSPDAVGVLARFDGAARPVLQRRYDLDACERVDMSANGDRIACFRHGLGVDLLAPGAAAPLLHRLVGTYDRAAFSVDGRYAFVQDPGTRMRIVDLLDPGRPLDVETGREAWPKTSHHRAVGVMLIKGRELWVDAVTGVVHRGATCDAPEFGSAQTVDVLADGSLVVGCLFGAMRRLTPAGVASTFYDLDPAYGPPVASDSDGGDLVVAQARDRLSVVDLSTGALVRSWSGGGSTIMELAIAGDRVVAAADDGGVLVWQVSTGQLVARLPSVRGHVRWLDAGRTLRVVGTVVEDWLLPERAPLPHVRQSGEGIAAIAISPDGAWIASAHGDGHVRVARSDRDGFVYDVPLDASVVKDVAFSPDGTLLAAICAGMTHVAILDVASGEVVRRLPSPRSRSLVWLDDGLIVTPYSGGLVWWSSITAPPVPIEAMSRAMDIQAWPDRRGATLLDSDAFLWDIRGAELPEVHRLTIGVESGSVASDGHRRVSLRGDVLVYRDADGAERAARADGGMPLWLTADPWFRRVAIGHQDGSVRVWSLPDLQLEAVLRGHASRVLALAFSADGRWLVTGSWDGDVRLWHMRPLDVSAAELEAEAVGGWGRSAHELLGRLAAP